MPPVTPPVPAELLAAMVVGSMFSALDEAAVGVVVISGRPLGASDGEINGCGVGNGMGVGLGRLSNTFILRTETADQEKGISTGAGLLNRIEKPLSVRLVTI